MPPEFLSRGFKTKNGSSQRIRTIQTKPVVSKVKAFWSKPQDSSIKHRTTPYSVPYTPPRAKVDNGILFSRSRIPILKHPPLTNKSPTVEPLKRSKANSSSQRNISHKANTLPVRINPNNTHSQRNRIKSETITRPLWLPSGRLSPKNQPNANARIPIRRRQIQKATTLPSSKVVLISNECETPTTLTCKPIRRSFRNLKYKGRTPSYILATTKEPLQPVNKKAQESNLKRPAIIPRKSLSREKPVPKPRRLTPRPTIDKNNNHTKFFNAESTWPRKSSPLLHKRGRGSRKSERKYNNFDNFKPIWLPVGTLSRLEKNSTQDASILKSNNIVNSNSVSQNKNTTKKTTNSIQKQSSIEKKKANSLPARILKPPRTKLIKKKETNTTNKPMWLPTGKLSTIKPAPMLKDKVSDSTSTSSLQRSLSRRRSARYRKKGNENLNTKTYVNVSKETSTENNPELRTPKLKVLPVSPNEMIPSKNTIKRLKRRRPKESIVVEESSFSPLFVKPIYLPPKRTSSTHDDNKRAQTTKEKSQIISVSNKSCIVLPNMSKRFPEGSLGRPPGPPVKTRLLDESSKMLRSSPKRAQGNHRRLPSRIPIKAKLDNFAPEPPMWLPASRYSRKNCRLKPIRTSNQVKSFLIVV